MKQFFTILMCMYGLGAYTQFTDDFSDGNFSANPAWSGTTGEFIVNASNELQLNNTIAASSYLSSPHGLSSINDVEWRIWVKQSFAPSSSNFGRVYLCSDQEDPATALNGYYLQLGEAGSTDAIRLFKLEAGVSTLICSGSDGQIAASFTSSIKVTRTASGSWELSADLSGGNNYLVLATGLDASTLSGTHFSILCTYTASNASKFFFDQVYVGPLVVDNTPPAIVSTTALSATNADILFSESVNQTSAENINNYSLNPSNTIISATRDVSNFALVHLVVSAAFADGINQSLSCNNMMDLAGNTAGALQDNFVWFAPVSPQPGDLIINEFFCDPSPKVGLPELEFVEIYNKSSKTFDLNAWFLGDAAADGTIAAGVIGPGEYRVLCASSSIDSFPNAIGVSNFPSLNNSGDDIRLKDPTGLIIDQITYDLSWYQDASKENGGYTIELINPGNLCSGFNNWTASTHPNGGTPGLVNSVYNATPDLLAPSGFTVEILPPDFISITFNEKMDSLSLVNTNISISPSLNVSARFLTESNPVSMLIQLDQPVATSVLYNITFSSVSDCSQNDTTLSSTFVLAPSAQAGDVVINEILFDPFTNGSDFVELYNRSGKIINLKGLSLANYDNDTIANIKTITSDWMLNPAAYAVITPDSTDQLLMYSSAIPGSFIQMSLPTLPSDSGTLYLLSGTTILDKVSYSDDWHFALLNDNDGKSLERLDANGPSNEASNWHTASEQVGFATPGRVNSQLIYGEDIGEIKLIEQVISPDNDGHQDILQLHYTMLQPGMVAKVLIYNDRGLIIKHLLEAELVGSEGNITWDGITEDKNKAAIGMYVVYFEAFDLEGKQFKKKLPFVVAGK